MARRGARVSIAAERPAPQHYGHNHIATIWWDCSDAPGKNASKGDRIKKLGHYWQTWGAAITEDDLKTKNVKIPDGMLVGGDIRSNFPPEPDCSVLRLHEARSRGRDNVWAPRLQVEHKNDAQRRDHRSSMWIDQCDDQNWAWSLDPFWIVRLGAVILDEELEFTGDGFLAILCGEPEDPAAPPVPTSGRSRPSTGAPVATPSRGRRRPTGPGQTQTLDGTDPGSTVVEPATQKRGKRELGALAVNISKKGGFLTDGGPIAQLWHILHIHPGDDLKACAPDKKQQGALRGDVNFSMTLRGKAVLAHLAIHDPPKPPIDNQDNIFKGHLYIDDPHPRPPKREMNLDPISPQPVLKRDLESGIHVWIGLPSILSSASIVSFMSFHVASLAGSIVSVALGSHGYGAEEPPKSQYSPGRTGTIISGVFSTNVGSSIITPGSGTNRAVTGNDGFGGAGPDETEDSGVEPIGLSGTVVDFSQLGN